MLCLPLCGCMYVCECLQVSYSHIKISLPTSLTDTHAADGVKSVKGKRYRRRRESLTDSLNSCARLCAQVLSLYCQRTLQLKSIITTAPVLQKCQHQLKRLSVCLFVCLCLLLFAFSSREHREKGRRMDD